MQYEGKELKLLLSVAIVFGEVFCSSYGVNFFSLPCTITCWVVSLTDKLVTYVFFYNRSINHSAPVMPFFMTL